MPLLVPTDELTPGMRLYEPLVVNGRIMLQGGKELTSGDIGVLRRRFAGVSIRIGDPVLDSVIEFEDDARDRQVASETQQQVAKSMSEVHRRFSERASLKDVNVSSLQDTVKDLMEYLKGNPVSAALVGKCMDANSYYGTHTGNVFYLSMLLAHKGMHHVIAERKRQTGARDLSHTRAADLVPLGLAAMVMDLGMLPIQHVWKENRPLTEEEAAAVRQHPLTGADALPDSFSPVARITVKTHHENWNGTGYPNQLSRERIHIFARIIRIADAYDAATSERIHQKAKSPARVLWEMTVGPYRRFYDPELLKCFAQLIQPFPIGAKLRLRDGRYAAVVKYNRSNPFDPQVIIAFDANNQPLPKDKLRGPLYLGSHRELRVASVAGEDMSFMYTQGSTEQVPQVSRFNNVLQSTYP